MKLHSIISSEKRCYMCGSSRWLELHHIMGNANRKNSTKYGLVVYLCHHCHNEPPNGVHFNKTNMNWLRLQGQIAFEKYYEKEDFLKIFGKNYK